MHHENINVFSLYRKIGKRNRYQCKSCMHGNLKSHSFTQLKEQFWATQRWAGFSPNNLAKRNWASKSTPNATVGPASDVIHHMRSASLFLLLPTHRSAHLLFFIIPSLFALSQLKEEKKSKKNILSSVLNRRLKHLATDFLKQFIMG